MFFDVVSVSVITRVVLTMAVALTVIAKAVAKVMIAAVVNGHQTIGAMGMPAAWSYILLQQSFQCSV